MSNPKDAPKTLFEIIETVLLEHYDSNLSSLTARNAIADEICHQYYDDIDPSSDEYDENIGDEIYPTEEEIF